MDCDVEALQCTLSNQWVSMLGRGDTKGPSAATPTVVGAPLIGPVPGAVHSIPRTAIAVLRREHKVERHTPKARHRFSIRLATGNHEQTGVVVGAIAVFLAAFDALGVFEQATLIAQTFEVTEGNRECWHVVSSPCAG
jgi:hypothetical protein